MNDNSAFDDSATTYWDASGAWVRGGKTRARAHCREIAARTPDRRQVTPADAAFLIELLHHHPDAAQKIGTGIQAFIVEKHPVYGSRGLRLYRADGSSTDFSWPECITPTPYATQVKTAMRLAVDPQILAFKQYMADIGQLRCGITGESLSFSTAEADHLPPEFKVIADTYAKWYDGYDEIPLVPSQDNQYGRPLATPHDGWWPGYHGKNAKLQILCVPCHKDITQQRRHS